MKDYKNWRIKSMATFKKNYARATYDSNGAVLSTVVSIFSTNGGTIIETTLKGDHLTKSEDEIVQLALDQFYEDTYPNKAENEKFIAMEKALKEKTATLDTTRKMLAQSVVKEFEYESNFEDIDAKLQFLATHLNITYPAKEEEADEKESSSSSREATTV